MQTYHFNNCRLEVSPNGFSLFDNSGKLIIDASLLNIKNTFNIVNGRTESGPMGNRTQYKIAEEIPDVIPKAYYSYDCFCCHTKIINIEKLGYFKCPTCHKTTYLRDPH
jgi:hypothetical protein